MAAFRSLHGSAGLFSLMKAPHVSTSILMTRTKAPTVSSLLTRFPAFKNRGGASPLLTMNCRFYTPLTPYEEKQEKQRVAALSDFAKEAELRQLNREIARLQMLRGINTGEAYTWTGKYKRLWQDYGFPFIAWYWCVWGVTAVACYGAVEFGGVDVMHLLARVDAFTGWDTASHVNPQYGKVGLVLVLNEMIEPLRLPVVVMTVKPVLDRIYPPKF